MDNNAPLWELIGSRICHDLVSPIGAIGNGLELINMTALKNTPELALVQESVDSANAKLRFFRLAFGQANADQMVPTAEVRSTLRALGHGSRMTYKWQATDSVSRCDVQAICLAVMCLETAMPYGGTIIVEQADTKWRLIANGRKVQCAGDLWNAMLEGAPPEVSARHVQFSLLQHSLQKTKRSFTLDHSESEAILTF
jgi:histidine phosphotransferase ChpT